MHAAIARTKTDMSNTSCEVYPSNDGRAKASMQANKNAFILNAISWKYIDVSSLR